MLFLRAFFSFLLALRQHVNLVNMQGAVIVLSGDADMMAFMALQRILVVNVINLVALISYHNQIGAYLYALLGAFGIGFVLGATFIIAYVTTDLLGLGCGGFVLGH